jgi:hypothetical protein
MIKPLAAAAAALLAGALWSHGARAQEVSPPPAEVAAPPPALVPPPPPPDLAAPPTQWGNRMLAGHTFLYPVLQPSSFITTNFGIDLGVYDESIPSVPIPGFRTADLSLTGATAAANLGVKITDWLDVEAQGRALAILGTSGQSLVYAGGQLKAGGWLAPKVRIARIESSGTQISARAQIGELGGESLQIPRLLVLARTAIAGVVQNPSDPLATARAVGTGLFNGGFPRVILAGADEFTLNGSVDAAQALGDMFGLQASLTFQRRVLGLTFKDPISGSFRESANRYELLFDLSAEWDANSLHVPVAVMLEYELNGRLAGTGTEELEDASTNTHTFGAGVYYSGREDLQVGLFAAAIRNLRPINGITFVGSPGTSGTPHAEYLEMVLRYIW